MTENNFRHFLPSAHALDELENCNARIAMVEEDILNLAWEPTDTRPHDLLKSEREYRNALLIIVHSPNPALRMLARAWVHSHWIA